MWAVCTSSCISSRVCIVWLSHHWMPTSAGGIARSLQCKVLSLCNFIVIMEWYLETMWISVYPLLSTASGDPWPWTGHRARTPSLWSLSLFGFWGLTCFGLSLSCSPSQALCGSSLLLDYVSTLGPNLQLSPLLSCGFKWHQKLLCSNSGTDLFPSFHMFHFPKAFPLLCLKVISKLLQIKVALPLIYHPFQCVLHPSSCSGQNLGLTLDSCVSYPPCHIHQEILFMPSSRCIRVLFPVSRILAIGCCLVS